jgi:hypothetical protein
VSVLARGPQRSALDATTRARADRQRLRSANQWQRLALDCGFELSRRRRVCGLACCRR